MPEGSDFARASAALSRAIKARNAGRGQAFKVERLEDEYIAALDASDRRHPSLLAFTTARTLSYRVLARLPVPSQPNFVLNGEHFDELLTDTSPEYVALAVSRGLSIMKCWPQLCRIAATDPAWERMVVEELATSRSQLDTFAIDWQDIHQAACPRILARILRQQVATFPADAHELGVHNVRQDNFFHTVWMYLAGLRIRLDALPDAVPNPSYQFIEAVQGGHGQMKIAQVIPDLEDFLADPEIIHRLPMAP